MRQFLLPVRYCLFGLCCACALLFLFPSAAGAQEPASSQVHSLLDVHKALVYIEAVGTFVPQDEAKEEVQVSQGSGFLISPDGLIVTNAHVVNGGEIFYVRLDGDDTRYNARLAGISECADLAVLVLAATGRTSPLPYLEFDQGEPRENMLVSAFGYPDGAEEVVRSRGRVTILPGRVDTRWASVFGVLWHSAKLSPGSSGGPLVAGSGKVVGVNYAGSTKDREYAAIGSAYALPILETLRSGQNLYSLGINGEVHTGGDDATGVWVVSVKAGSAADKAGVLPGDVLIELAGSPVGAYGSLSTYCDIIRSHDAADVLPISVLRGEDGELWAGQLNGQPLAAVTSGPAAVTAGENLAAAGAQETGGDVVEDHEEYARLTNDTGELVINAPAGWELLGSDPVLFGAVQAGAVLLAANPQSLTRSSGVASSMSFCS